jgi:hypothetical protein
MKDYKDLLPAIGMNQSFDLLREYYDSNYLATIFAPLFPAHARNCLWVVDKHGQGATDFDVLSALIDPSNSSSTLWSEFVRDI